ncbi:hypothetical protein [Actinomadura decatromicini]|uniref:Guanylate cyclase domain-containing protein n=1 Tax=Actinomadura decatromicini TaxID=2604572 RepID=A0A5D3FFF5_9ACTN|nr:hypothetical protein [Actinomadura decatromicini]TYK46981.1 hypothetical protein FXF68_24495 [Actinomadura decatromicini]
MIDFFLRNVIGQPNPAGAKPRHQLLAANDIRGFSQYDEATKISLHKALYRITRQACDTAGVPWRSARPEDRGDGILMIPKSAGLEVLLTVFLDEIRSGIRAHNRTISDERHALRLRMALADGYVHREPHGVIGMPVNFLFRLLEAETFKQQLKERNAEFGLILSDQVHQIAVDYRLIGAKSFIRTQVDVKETHTNGWTWIPLDDP